jgi:hypothetical protein
MGFFFTHSRPHSYPFFPLPLCSFADLAFPPENAVTALPSQLNAVVASAQDTRPAKAWPQVSRVLVLANTATLQKSSDADAPAKAEGERKPKSRRSSMTREQSLGQQQHGDGFDGFDDDNDDDDDDEDEDEDSAADEAIYDNIGVSQTSKDPSCMLCTLSFILLFISNS